MPKVSSIEPSTMGNERRGDARSVTCKDCQQPRMWKPHNSFDAAPERCRKCSLKLFKGRR